MNIKLLLGRAVPVAVVALVLFACSGTPQTPSKLKESAIACMRSQDFECAQRRWQAYVRLRPNDSNAIANLGIAENKLDENEAAVVEFRQAIDLGEGTYDLFSYYADSLSKLGKTDQAIDWYYKALTVVPSLVDVRASLAKLLVQKKHYFEALALLSSFDDHLKAIGYPAYFEGQRIAIETAMQQANPDTFAERSLIRLPETYGNFYAPVTLGQSHVTAFVVDTGATLTTVNPDFLQQSKTRYEVIRRSVEMQTANGERIRARLINIDSMKLGAFPLRDISAIVCSDCQLLLGQATLSQFDLSSSKVEGVEFLTLRLRKSE